MDETSVVSDSDLAAMCRRYKYQYDELVKAAKAIRDVTDGGFLVFEQGGKHFRLAPTTVPFTVYEVKPTRVVSDIERTRPDGAGVLP